MVDASEAALDPRGTAPAAVRLQLPSAAGPCTVLLERGLFEVLELRLAAVLDAAPTRVALVTDRNVDARFGAAARASLERLAPVSTVVLEPGEPHKTLATLQAVCVALARAGLDRRSLVVGLGGGVVGDLAGFAAAVFLRGIRHVLVPTTLLAQVDAALGGKTGVDLAEGKNLVGAFHPPRAVLIDPDLLRTLPGDEWRNGSGELAKYAVIDGGAQLRAALATLLAQPPADPAALDALIERCVRIKVDLCAADERDHGVRRVLNLGHTLGHALEAASGYRGPRHGEAVAMGLVAEAALAERLGLAAAGLAREIRELIAALGLPVRAPGADRTRIRSALRADKKRDGDAVRFALPRAWGTVEVVEVTDGPDLDWAIATLAP